MASIDRVGGVLLGTALGDAMGLPFEGLRPARVARRLARASLRPSLVLGRTLISDDTEHTCMVARALLQSGGDPAGFELRLGRELARWITTLPPGVGLATLRGCLRLRVGIAPRHSGVHSAGNGPAMRSALIGVLARDDEHLLALTRSATTLTHTDPRALDGALVVARLAAGVSPDQATAAVDDAELRGRLHEAIAASTTDDLEVFRARSGYQRGVSGFVVHTVPASVYCWLRGRGDPKSVIEASIRLGGDTDTVAAIAGALVGAEVGARGLPRDWLNAMVDWPTSVASIEALATAVGEGGNVRPPSWTASVARNLVVTTIVVAHVIGRLLGR